MNQQPKISILDLVPVVEGQTLSQSYQDAVVLAQAAERLNYERYWVAEHHSMEGIASAATSVVLGHVAGATTTLKVGSGGIMLPNHPPLVIAEQFGTLEAMYPNRIELGLGRAPGSDPKTAMALRKDPRRQGQDFPELLQELRDYINPKTMERGQVRAIPGEGQNIPIWLLGSSDFSARLAGQLGLPFGFAAHFSPHNTLPAMRIYRESFRPSEVLDQPYALVCLNVFAAETYEEAEYIATSSKQQFLSLIRGNPGKLPRPVKDMDEVWSPMEKAAVMQQLAGTIIGNPDQVEEELSAFTEQTQAQELMVVSNAHDFNQRLKTYEIIAERMIRHG